MLEIATKVDSKGTCQNKNQKENISKLGRAQLVSELWLRKAKLNMFVISNNNYLYGYSRRLWSYNSRPTFKTHGGQYKCTPKKQFLLKKKGLCALPGAQCQNERTRVLAGHIYQAGLLTFLLAAYTWSCHRPPSSAATHQCLEY